MTFDANSLQGAADSSSFGLLAVSLLLSVLAISLSALVLWRWRRHEARVAAVPEAAPTIETARQLLHEFEKIKRDFSAGDLFGAIHSFKRVRTIMKVLVAQVDILETMTPSSFSSFRDRLETASGSRIQARIHSRLREARFSGI